MLSAQPIVFVIALSWFNLVSVGHHWRWSGLISACLIPSDRRHKGNIVLKPPLDPVLTTNQSSTLAYRFLPRRAPSRSSMVLVCILFVVLPVLLCSPSSCNRLLLLLLPALVCALSLYDKLRQVMFSGSTLAVAVFELTWA